MTDLTIIPKPIRQDNLLVESCYSLNLNEKRLLLIGMSLISFTKIPKVDNPLSFKIKASDWINAYPDCAQPYRDMKRASNSLLPKHVTFKQSHKIVDKINWLEKCRYNDGDGSIEITFTYSISLYLAGMVDKFTQYDFLSVQKFNSVYSIRLFELLSQFKSTGFRVDTIESLRFSLDCVAQNPLWNDFNRRIIKPAVKEINDKTQYVVTYKTVCTGKKVVAVRFSFSEKLQGDLFK